MGKINEYLPLSSSYIKRNSLHSLKVCSKFSQKRSKIMRALSKYQTIYAFVVDKVDFLS